MAMNHSSGERAGVVRRALVLALLIACAALSLAYLTRATDRPRLQADRPACVGYRCATDRDCGSRCRCDRPSADQVGTCVALSRPQVR